MEKKKPWDNINKHHKIYLHIIFIYLFKKTKHIIDIQLVLVHDL